MDNNSFLDKVRSNAQKEFHQMQRRQQGEQSGFQFNPDEQMMLDAGFAPIQPNPETQNNSVLGWLKDSVDSGIAGVLGGQAELVNAYTGVGGDTAKYFSDMAQRNRRDKEYNPEDIIPFASDYYTNPQGFVYDTGNLIGSMLALGGETAALAVGAKAALGYFGLGGLSSITSALATRAGAAGMTRLASALKSPVGAVLVANVAKTPLEIASEGGNTIADVREAGGDLETQKKAAVTNMLIQTPLLTLSNMLESSGLGVMLGKSADKTTSSIAGKAAKAIGGVGAGAAQQSWEEGMQEASGNYAKGERKNLTGVVNPLDWEGSEIQSAAAAFAPGMLFGGAGMGAGHVARKYGLTKSPANDTEQGETIPAIEGNTQVAGSGIVNNVRNLQGRIPYYADDGTNCMRTLGMALSGTPYEGQINVDQAVATASNLGQLMNPNGYTPRAGDIAVVNNGGHVVMVTENGGTIQNGQSANGVYEVGQSPQDMFGKVDYYIRTSDYNKNENTGGVINAPDLRGNDEEVDSYLRDNMYTNDAETNNAIATALESNDREQKRAIYDLIYSEPKQTEEIMPVKEAREEAQAEVQKEAQAEVQEEVPEEQEEAETEAVPATPMLQTRFGNMINKVKAGQGERSSLVQTKNAMVAKSALAKKLAKKGTMLNLTRRAFNGDKEAMRKFKSLKPEAQEVLTRLVSGKPEEQSVIELPSKKEPTIESPSQAVEPKDETSMAEQAAEWILAAHPDNPAKGLKEEREILRQQYNKALEPIIEELKGGMKQGVEIIRPTGVGRGYRQSRNMPWYSDFYKIHKRPPNKYELEQIAYDVLTGAGNILPGWQNDSVESGAYYADMKRQLDSLQEMIDALDEAENLLPKKGKRQRPKKQSANRKAKQVKEQLPNVDNKTPSAEQEAKNVKGKQKAEVRFTAKGEKLLPQTAELRGNEITVVSKPSKNAADNERLIGKELPNGSYTLTVDEWKEAAKSHGNPNWAWHNLVQKKFAETFSNTQETAEKYDPLYGRIIDNQISAIKQAVAAYDAKQTATAVDEKTEVPAKESRFDGKRAENTLDKLIGRKKKEEVVETSKKFVDVFDESELDAELVAARAELNKLSANPFFNPVLMKTLVKIGGIYVQKGVNNFANWSIQMAESLGNEVKPFLKAVWNTLQAYPTGVKFNDDIMTAVMEYVGSKVDDNHSLEDIRNEFAEQYGDEFLNYVDAAYNGILEYPTEIEGKNEVVEEVEEANKEQAETVNAGPHSESKTEQENANAGPQATFHENEGLGGIEVSFKVKPSTDVIAGLKSAGYRWSSKKKLWYAKKNNKSMDFAKSIGYNPSEVVELKQDENKGKVGSDNDERKRTDKSVSGEYAGKGPNPVERNVYGSVVSQTGERADSARVDKRGENAEVQTLTPAQEAKSPKEIPGKNFTITNDINLGEGGVKTKYKNNIEAIRLLKTLEAENRNSTPAEQKILAKYVGWGGLSQVFDVGRDGEGIHAEWRSEAKELKELLTEKEYKAARRSTTTSFYTPVGVIKEMYNLLGRLGFKSGKILEPSMGVGNFFGVMPEVMRSHSALNGVELDSLTGRIAKQLYQSANVEITGFEKTNFPDGYFDLAISNVPFGSFSVHDPKYNKYNLFIHDYFFAKALDQVRDGGIVCFVTATGTMDSRSGARFRERINSKADFLGAVRLPNTTFKATANTSASADIIVLQKRGKGVAPSKNAQSWVNVKGLEIGYPVNEYFVERPDMVIGTLERGYNTLTVNGNGLDVAKELAARIKNFPTKTYKAKTSERNSDSNKSAETFLAPSNVKDGSFVLEGSKAYVNTNGKLEERPAALQKKTKNYISLRDVTKKILAQQIDESISDEALQATRKELNKIYDTFVTEHGAINDAKNTKVLAIDPDYGLVQAIEKYEVDPETKAVTVEKRDIFTRRTVNPFKTPTSADNVNDALTLSLSTKGTLDVDYMGELLGNKDTSDIITELGDRIFKNPDSESYELAEEYLSGDVRAKLETAKVAAKTNSAYQRNVRELEKVIPQDLVAEDIRVALGVPWIPDSDVTSFAAYLLGTSNTGGNVISVASSPATGGWAVRWGKHAGWVKNSTEATQTWGTNRKDVKEILEALLNKRSITVTNKDKDGKTVVDSAATAEVNAKAEQIQKEFKEWLFKDDARKKRLLAYYNNNFNNWALRKYDGSHLSLPGYSTVEYPLRQHQKDAVWRILQDGTCLLAHCVGAGKTWTMQTAAMEMKRLGLAHKSMFVVPNHMTKQFENDFRRIYPNAKLLIVTTDKLPAVTVQKRKGMTAADYKSRVAAKNAKRQNLLGNIATEDWDGIIISHNMFERIPLSPQRYADFYNEQVNELRNAIDEISYSSDNASRSTVKEIEKTITNLEKKLAESVKEDAKDIVIPFEQLGVDQIFVDEADLFKNLGFATKMGNIKGMSNSNSQRSVDMFTKTQYLMNNNNGRGVVFATGTPISNTMAEMFTMLRYLDLKGLKDKGMSFFDNWAATFAMKETTEELSPDGNGWRIVEKFTKFANMPELTRMFRKVADVKQLHDLDLDVPKVRNGKPTVIEVPINDALDHYIHTNALKRAEAIRTRRVTPSEDNMLKLTTDLRKASLDIRLVDPTVPASVAAGKINAVSEQVMAKYNETKDVKGVQLVFCDISTPKGLSNKVVESTDADVTVELAEEQGNVSAYENIKAALIAKGIPAKEIAFIHDAKTPTQKEILFSRCRNSKIRVLIGSTEKMGAGTNIQDHLVALHHVDSPWRPRDIEQREGRIVRQGNKNEEVEIFTYVTKGSFDANMWEKLKNKAMVIAQALSGNLSQRVVEDNGEVVLNFAEVQALATGNPLMAEQVMLGARKNKYTALLAAHNRNKSTSNERIKFLPDAIARNEENLKKVEADVKAMRDIKGDNFNMVLGRKVVYKRSEAKPVIDSLAKTYKNELGGKIGEIGGFGLKFKHVPAGSYIHSTDGKTLFATQTSSVTAELVGNEVYPCEPTLGSIEYAAQNAPIKRRDQLKADNERLKKELKELENSQNTPFEYQSELDSVTTRLEEIDSLLAEGVAEKNGEKKYQAAYHGTPHMFDSFDLSAIGTGEGAQAHGWGLYFAGDEDVAQGYKEKLTNRESDINIIYDGKKVGTDSPIWDKFFWMGILQKEWANNPNQQKELSERARREQENARKNISTYREKIKSAKALVQELSALGSDPSTKAVLEKENRSIEDMQKDIDWAQETLSFWEATDVSKLVIQEDKPSGFVFEVDIPESDVLLDEDKKFSEQPQKVQEALQAISKELNTSGEIAKAIASNKNGKKLYEAIAVYAARDTSQYNNNLWMVASRTLNDYGVKGITYDGHTDGRCYVIFDDKAIEIRHQYDAFLGENKDVIKRSYDEVLAELKDTLPSSAQVKYDGNDIVATMPNGNKIRAIIKDEIIVNEKEEARAREAHGLKDNGKGVGIEGYWQKFNAGDVDGLIALSKKSDKGAAYHEMLHAAMDLSLTAKENEVLTKHFTEVANKKGIAVTEAIAYGFRDWVLARQKGKGTMFGKIFKTILDFLKKMQAVFQKQENVHNIFRKLESGEAWEGDGKEVGSNGQTNYAVNSDVDPDTDENAYYSIKQAISSARTSIRQIPAIFKKIPWKPNTVNIDIGGGKYDDSTNFAKEQGVENIVFDPYNRSEEHNRKAFERIKQGGDTVTVANVLNVIAEQASRANVIKEAARAVKSSGTVYFGIYEGTKDGVGRKTNVGTWQNNRKTADYVDEVRRYFTDVKRSGNMIVAKNPIVRSNDTATWSMDGNNEAADMHFSVKTDDIQYSVKTATENAINNLKGLVGKKAIDERIEIESVKQSKSQQFGFLESIIRSPGWIAEKYPQFTVFFKLADKAMQTQERLRGEFDRAMKRVYSQMKSEADRNTWQDLLLKGDVEGREYTKEELRLQGISEGVISAYVRTRSVMQKAYNLLNDARKQVSTHQKNMSAGQLKKLRENKFIEVVKAEYTDDDNYLVVYKSPKVWTKRMTVDTDYLAELKEQKDTVQIISDDLLGNGSHAVVWRERVGDITKRGGYIPHFFHDYFIMRRGENGKDTVIGSGRTLEDATRKSEAFLEKNPDNKIIIAPKMFSFSDDESLRAATIGDTEYRAVVQKVTSDLEMTPSEAKEFLQGKVKVKGRHRFFGNFKKRKGAEGFETNMNWVLKHYLYSVARYVALEEFKPAGIGVFERYFGAFDKDYSSNPLAHYVKQYINDMNGNPSNIETMINNFLNRSDWYRKHVASNFGDRAALQLASSITGKISILKLGFLNVSSAMLNLSQLMNTVGLLGEFAPVAAGMKNALANPSMSDRKIYKETGIMNDIAMDTTSGYGKFKPGNVAAKTMYLFRTVDMYARKATVLAAYHSGKSKGMTHEQAISYAKEINRKANFNYGVSDAPNVFRRGSVFSQIALQFKKYPIKELELMHELIAKGTKAQNAKFWGTYFLLCGLLQVPMSDWLDDIWKELFGNSPKTKIKKMVMESVGDDPVGKELAKIAIYGIGSASPLNIDMSNRAGVGDVTFAAENGLSGLLGGATLNTAQQFARAVSSGNTLASIKALSPALGNYMQAVMGHTEVRRGRKGSELDTMHSQILKAAGFRNVEDSIASDVQSVVVSERNARTNARQRIIDSVIAKQSAGEKLSAKDVEELKRLGVTGKQLNDERKKKQTDARGRMHSSLSKREQAEHSDLLDFLKK